MSDITGLESINFGNNISRIESRTKAPIKKIGKQGMWALLAECYLFFAALTHTGSSLMAGLLTAIMPERLRPVAVEKR